MATSLVKDDTSRWKPDNLKNHLTLREVAVRVGRDESRIRQLERAGRIAAPIRVKFGRTRVRLYSPAEVAKIVTYFKNARPGNPNLQRVKISKRKPVSKR